MVSRIQSDFIDVHNVILNVNDAIKWDNGYSLFKLILDIKFALLLSIL